MVGGVIALVEDGDQILIDAENGIIELKVKDEILDEEKNLRLKSKSSDQVHCGSSQKQLDLQDTERSHILAQKKKRKFIQIFNFIQNGM